MSIWTHVTGAIRFDGIAVSLQQRAIQRAHLIQVLGGTCKFDSPRQEWDNCTVPCGSEGSLQYHLHEYHTGLPWMAVLVWGDLRDYSNIQEITDWFLKVCKGWPMVRQGIIEIQCGDERKVVQYEYEEEPKEAA